MFVFPLGTARLGLRRWLALGIHFVFPSLIYRSSFPKLPTIVLMEPYSFLFHCPRKDGFEKKERGNICCQDTEIKTCHSWNMQYPVHC